jgi:hypothetical protein
MKIKNINGEVTISPKEQEKENLKKQLANNPKPTTVAGVVKELEMIKQYLGLTDTK